MSVFGQSSELNTCQIKVLNHSCKNAQILIQPEILKGEPTQYKGNTSDGGHISIISVYVVVP